MGFFIVFILMIAVLSFTPFGKAIAQAILVNSGAVSPDNLKLQELEKRLKETEEELNKLREIIILGKETSAIKQADGDEVNRRLQSLV